MLPINLFAFHEGKIKILHLTWFAFFITFIMWFSQASLLPFIKQAFALTDSQVKALLILNVALTIPARILIGVLVDKFGPRLAYSLLLAISACFCFGYALADSFEMLALMRFLVGFVGAGFVIGIRLVSEWFPAKEVGFAEGIYGGWGNFGAAVASGVLPVLAAFYGGDNGWRWAVATTGFIALFYSVVFYTFARNTPKGSHYFRPKKLGGLEITSRFDFWFYLIMTAPLIGCLYLLAWRLSPAGTKLLSETATYCAYAAVTLLGIYQYSQILKVNKDIFKREVPAIQRYKFKQVAVLDLAYLASFGSEIAVVSMLPLYFMTMFGITAVQAGLMAGCFTVANLIARPAGGLFSDKFGRKKVLGVTLVGQAIGYLLLSQINASWWIGWAVAATLVCSLSVQAACGAVYSVVPLVQRRMTGQIAGMVGAYGNVGSVIFLTLLTFLSPHLFFTVLAGVSAVTFVAAQFLSEPKGHMAEVLEDGTVQLIEVE